MSDSPVTVTPANTAHSWMSVSGVARQSRRRMRGRPCSAAANQAKVAMPPVTKSSEPMDQPVRPTRACTPRSAPTASKRALAPRKARLTTAKPTAPVPSTSDQRPLMVRNRLAMTMNAWATSIMVAALPRLVTANGTVGSTSVPIADPMPSTNHRARPASASPEEYSGLPVARGTT